MKDILLIAISLTLIFTRLSYLEQKEKLEQIKETCKGDTK